ALEATLRRLRLFLQRRGRLLGHAEGKVVERGERRVLSLAVTPGPLTPILQVRFPGASSLPETELRERVGARRGHPWRWGGETVDEETLAADASSLLGTFQQAGFADAQVEAARIVAERTGVAIEFPIIEGLRRVVATVEVEGLPAGLTPPALALVKGSPWSSLAEMRSREAVQALLEERGYADSLTRSEHRCDGEGQCEVRLRIEPGPLVTVGRVVVAGLARTRRSVVETVAALHEGQVAGPEAQLAAQRRLLALGIFQRAAVRQLPGQAAGGRRGLLLDLAEGPTRALAFGLGWDTEERARASISWSELNLFGGARSLGLQARLSSRRKHLQVSYREPARLGLLGFPTWVEAYRTEEDFGSFKLLRRGTWVEFGDRQRRPTHLVLRYEYQIVDPEAPPEILSELERDKQRLAIAALTPYLEWDTRDDIFSPRRGAFASLALQSAFKAFLGDAEFAKLTASVTAFTPLRGGVLVAAARGGGLQPRGNSSGACDVTANPGGCENLAAPISVRFFGGGRVSHRAFATDRLGIRGKTLACPQGGGDCQTSELQPVGGAGELFSSLEWRFPLLGVIGGNVFLDGGNIWSSWREVQTSELRWGAGLGLRVETPVGPLRLEYGWKLDRETGESPGELFLSFGNPF
ncbi:MAG: BamA/TamA family outer membrane protein, partial [Acidobacteriota bacterium]